MSTSTDVLLGMGGCVDHEVSWDAGVIEAAVREHKITTADLLAVRNGTGDGGSVRGERELVLTLLAQLASGNGSERFVEDPTALLTFAHRFQVRVSLGGSSVRAAVALDRLGVASTLHLVSMDDDVRRLLPRSADYMCSAQADSTDPHVIVQYPAGAQIRVGESVVQAPRANRLIFVNDKPNAELRIADRFGAGVAAARVVVVSGFNSMTGLDAVRERTAQVRSDLARRSTDATVVYEDAGFHHDDQREVVLDQLRGAVDIWSMNEDEAQHYLQRELDLLDPEAVAEAVTQLHALLGVPTLVLHTGRWALAQGPIDLRAALRSGVSTATARYAYGDGWQMADRDRVAAMASEAAVASAAAEIEERLAGTVAVVPIPDLTVPEPTTIGLGDTFLGGLVAGVMSR